MTTKKNEQKQQRKQTQVKDFNVTPLKGGNDFNVTPIHDSGNSKTKSK